MGGSTSERTSSTRIREGSEASIRCLPAKESLSIGGVLVPLDCTVRHFNRFFLVGYLRSGSAWRRYFVYRRLRGTTVALRGILALPLSGQPTALNLTCWVCGEYPSSPERTPSTCLTLTASRCSTPTSRGSAQTSSLNPKIRARRLDTSGFHVQRSFPTQTPPFRVAGPRSRSATLTGPPPPLREQYTPPHPCFTSNAPKPPPCYPYSNPPPDLPPPPPLHPPSKPP